MSRQRLSKTQLKRDRFVEQTFDWAHWAETHRREVLAGLGVLVLAVAGFFIYKGIAAEGEEAASGDYMEARQAYFAGNYPLAASDLSAFIREHGDSSYGDDAKFFRAEALYRAGDTEAAVEALEEFLDEEGGSPFAPTVRRILANAYTDVQRFDEAEALYREAIDDAGYDARRAEIQEDLARMYEVRGDREAATEIYRMIAAEAPDTELARKAERRAAELSVQPLVVGGTSSDASGAGDGS